jgi:hypothetical protein
MVRHNDFSLKVKQVLGQALRERIPDKYPIHLEVVPKEGYENLVDLFIVTDYFKRLRFFKRVDFVGKILDSQLPPNDALRATIFPFTTREAERIGINAQIAQSG